MDRPTIIPADPVAAAEMAEQDANTETTTQKPRLGDTELAEQNERTGRAVSGRADIERSNAAEQRGRTA